jgi:hypothetical protein
VLVGYLHEMTERGAPIPAQRGGCDCRVALVAAGRERHEHDRVTRNQRRALPSFRAGPHAGVINFASATPSKIRGRAEFALYLRLSTASNPSSTNCRRVRRILATLVSTAAAIRLSLQPLPASDTLGF